jgi:hypothetical protein
MYISFFTYICLSATNTALERCAADVFYRYWTRHLTHSKCLAARTPTYRSITWTTEVTSDLRMTPLLVPWFTPEGVFCAVRFVIYFIFKVLTRKLSPHWPFFQGPFMNIWRSWPNNTYNYSEMVTECSCKREWHKAQALPLILPGHLNFP